MKKSLNPLRHNYVENEADYFGREITSYLDDILFLNNEEFIKTITDLESLSSALIAGEAIVTTGAITKLQEFYTDAESNFNEDYDEDCPQTLRSMVLEAIARFTALLKKELADGIQQERINARKERHEQETKSREANKALLARRQNSDDYLTPAEILANEEFTIFTKLRADATLCLKVAELMEKVDNFIDSDLTDDNQDAVMLDILSEFTEMLKSTLDIDYPAPLELNSESIKQIGKLLVNIFLLFQAQDVTIKDFNRDYNKENKWFLINNPYAILGIILASEGQEGAKELAISLAKRIWEISLTTPGDNSESVALEARLEILKKVIIKYSMPVDLLHAWSDEFVQSLLLRCEQTKDEDDKVKKSKIETIADTLNEQNKQSLVYNPEGNECASIEDIFKFPEETILLILDRCLEIEGIYSYTTIKLKELLSLDNKALTIWLSNKDDDEDKYFQLSRIKTLVNYFFMPKKHVLRLSVDDLKQILDNPQLAVGFFNKNARPFSDAELVACLNNIIARAQAYVTALNNKGYLVNLNKIHDLPKDIVVELQDLGLDFYQFRAIYEVVFLINHGFVSNYVKDLNENDFLRYRSIYNCALQVRFGAKQVKIIDGIFESYCEYLDSVLKARTAELPEKFAYIKDLISDVGDLDANEVCMVLENRTGLSTLTDGTMTTEHLGLLHYLQQSGIDEYDILCDFISRFKDKFSSMKIYPLYDMANYSGADENALLRAIYWSDNEDEDEDEDIISAILESGVDPIGYNCKNVSYLSCAAGIAFGKGESVYNLIKAKIETATERKLMTYLAHNKIVSKSLGYQLSFAIQDGCAEIVLALIVRGADIHTKAVGFELSPLALAVNSNKPNRELILNDLLANLQYNSMLKARVQIEAAKELGQAASQSPKLMVA